MLSYTHTIDQGRPVFSLVGQLDEQAVGGLERLLEAHPAGDVTLDLAAVASINSAGARVWAEFATRLRKRGVVRLRRCSPYVVDYVIMVPAMIDDLVIESFFAPMRCVTCGETEALLDAEVVRVTRAYGKHSCRSCKEPLAPLVSEDDYFDFLD